MRVAALTLIGSLALATATLATTAANAAPAVPQPGAPTTANVVQVWGGCGPAFHPNGWGYCVPNYYGGYGYGGYGYYHPHWHHWYRY